MFLENLVVGPLECNCIIFGCKKTKEAVVIDPGDEATRILNCLNQNGLHLKYILQTHAHIDHIGGARDLQKAAQTEVLLHQSDLLVLASLQMQALMFGLETKTPPKINRFIKEDDKITVGDYEMRVIHSPGHSPGSVCFYMLYSVNPVRKSKLRCRRRCEASEAKRSNHEAIRRGFKPLPNYNEISSPPSRTGLLSNGVNGDEKHILFAGDTLFYRSIGRYDLPGGSYEQLMASIRDKLFVLPDDTIVYPGHGPMTTIGEEKQDNPFLYDLE